MVAAAVFAGAFAAGILVFGTAACSPSPGHPVALHVGIAVVGAAVAAVPALWARWAKRRSQWSVPWWAMAVLLGAATVVIDASARVSGCPFVF